MTMQWRAVFSKTSQQLNLGAPYWTGVILSAAKDLQFLG